jgi:predicted ribosome quality control (RQC) complex YloA/Tae2 family protein
MKMDTHLEEEKTRLERVLNRQLKRVQKRILTWTQNLKECELWKSKMHEATLLQANQFRLKKGIKEICVSDWEQDMKEVQIVLNPLLLPHEEIAKRFRVSKKLKAGLKNAHFRLEKAQQEEHSLSVLKERLNILTTLQELSSFVKEIPFLQRPIPSKKSDEVNKNITKLYREFMTEAGLAILVGKSARDNDQLTFMIAHGNDWWFHAHDYSGSHVVLRCSKHADPDSESIQDAIQLALFYSKAKDKGEGDVCVTQKKFVSRMKNYKSGQVVISKHKLVRSNIDLKRLDKIRQRKCPSNLLL